MEMVTPQVSEQEKEEAPGYFPRFNWTQRLEHHLVMVTFLVLIGTGLPQRYSQAGWAQWLVLHMGGIDLVRLIHRVFAFLFAFAAFYHVGRVSYDWFARGRRPAMFIAFVDLKDMVSSLRYYLGFSSRQPWFDRYSFRQKFEYWGLVFGGTIMLVSGFILMYPTLVTRGLPGDFVPAAKLAHGYEGLLAFLVVLIWHLYGAHLGPGRFPMDTSIFTGRISRKRLREEHFLEYQRLTASTEPEAGVPPSGEVQESEEKGS